MTCPLVQRLMQIVEGFPRANAMQIVLYRSSGHELLCQIDWKPANEDTRRTTGRGPDCLCEALGQIEAGLNVLQTSECLGCAAHAATE